MSIFIITDLISECYLVFSEYSFTKSLSYVILFIIDIFYPMGELISPQSLRCRPFAVVHYSFMGYCLAFAATSTRE